MESTIFVFLPIKIEFINDLVPIFENSTSCFEKKDELCLEPVDWHSVVESCPSSLASFVHQVLVFPFPCPMGRHPSMSG